MTVMQGQRIPGLVVPALDQQETISIDDHEILKADSDSDDSPAAGEFNRSRSGGGGEFEVFTRNGFAPLQDNTSHHATIKKCLLDGLGQCGGGSVAVTAIHRNSISVPNARARFLSFRAHEKAAAEKSGDGQARARYAWYGGSKDEIRQILSFGFSRCAAGHGVGVHLAAISFPTDCFDSAIADENGNKHLLLCRVLLGKVEAIAAGSNQSAPSSVDYDSGVDDLTKPRKYIVWSSFMNSHIFPAFIISFKDPDVNGMNRGAPVSSITRPRSPWMSFPTLLRLLSGLLDPSIMTMVSKSYEDFRHHKITREQMIRVTRRLVGDELLSSVVKTHQKQELANRVIPRT
ncbi:Probable inactive poly [ADP-ribose] polymerase SRO2 [Linum grandiflorum]